MSITPSPEKERQAYYMLGKIIIKGPVACPELYIMLKWHMTFSIVAPSLGNLLALGRHFEDLTMLEKQPINIGRNK